MLFQWKIEFETGIVGIKQLRDLIGSDLISPNYKNYQSEVKLSGVLSEFRIALNEEIEAARRHESSSAVPLVNGRRIAQIGSSYQYIFQIENVLNLPGDAPGDLLLPNRSSLSIFVISIDGLTITLSIPEDIGSFVPSARLQSNLAFLMRKLIERIEAHGNKPNHIGDRIMAPEQVSGTVIPISVVDLDNYQSRAVASSLSYNTSFIWGPPGTGKTITIGEIGNQLYKQQRSVLVVSHTNTAVDQAILRIADKIPSDELSKGRVLRVGEPKDKRLIDHPNLLLATHVTKRAEEFTTRRQDLYEELNTASEESSIIFHLINILEWVTNAGKDIYKMDQDLRALQKEEELLEAKRSEFNKLANQKGNWIEATSEAKAIQQLIAESSKVKSDIDLYSITILRLSDDMTDINDKLVKAQVIYDETSSVGMIMRHWKRLPNLEEQKKVVDNLQSEKDKLGFNLDLQKNALDNINQKYSKYLSIIESYNKKMLNPEDVLHQASLFNNRFAQVKEDISKYAQLCTETRNNIEDLFNDRLLALKDMSLTNDVSASAESMLNAIKYAFEQASLAVVGLEFDSQQKELKRINDLISRCETEIKEIDEALKHIEDLIISEASIIATTLTRAYLRESIQARRFDSVILDEASMAPIPALWIAASIADSNAIVVGDPKQLPPIVISNHDLAKKWLGRDIFEVAGFKGYEYEKTISNYASTSV